MEIADINVLEVKNLAKLRQGTGIQLEFWSLDKLSNEELQAPWSIH